MSQRPHPARRPHRDAAPLGFPLVFPLAIVLALGGCDAIGGSSGPEGRPDVQCSIPQSRIYDGGPPKDGIPALSDPDFVGRIGPDAERSAYLADDDRVIGLLVDGEALAIPHNILWFHEIVNLDRGDRRLAVTYCPLTGSSLAFDRAPVGGGEFGVSGLLFRNNLLMYDRTSEESLWPQMMREARCGPRDGTMLPMYPIVEMTWDGWTSLHPETKVVSSATGHDFDYRASNYPYGNYESPSSPPLFPMEEVDDRRPPKERVLGIAAEGEPVAFPFGELDGDVLRVVHTEVDGKAIVVFWDGDRRAAAAFRPSVDGETLSFEVIDGTIVDRATGSDWRVDGRAVAGPLAGSHLPAFETAYVAFWFAWAAFHPETAIWTADAGAR
ncbi:MAG: DUF3179 domain-containing protein [Gemmatimonadota bacterium]